MNKISPERKVELEFLAVMHDVEILGNQFQNEMNGVKQSA